MSKLDSFGIPQTNPDQLFEHCSMHLYGPPGTGKTLFLGSIQEVEELCPILIVDTEGSTSVLAGKIDPEKLHIRRISEWHKGARQMLEYLANEPQDHGYKTVCIDTFPGLQQLMTRRAGDIREAKGGNMNNALEMGTPTEADWGAVGTMMVKTLDAFNKAPLMFITTAHPVVDGKEIRPALQGKMTPNDLPGRPYMVGYMDMIPPGTPPNKTSGPVPVAYFGYHTVNGRKTWAKDRSGKINGGLLAPTMRKVYDRVKTATTTAN